MAKHWPTSHFSATSFSIFLSSSLGSFFRSFNFFPTSSISCHSESGRENRGQEGKPGLKLCNHFIQTFFLILRLSLVREKERSRQEWKKVLNAILMIKQQQNCKWKNLSLSLSLPLWMTWVKFQSLQTKRIRKLQFFLLAKGRISGWCRRRSCRSVEREKKRRIRITIRRFSPQVVSWAKKSHQVSPGKNHVKWGRQKKVERGR